MVCGKSTSSAPPWTRECAASICSVSVDPERDTPEALKRYADAHRANGYGWSTDYPYAGINLMIRVSELTRTPVAMEKNGAPNYWVVRLTDDASRGSRSVEPSQLPLGAPSHPIGHQPRRRHRDSATRRPAVGRHPVGERQRLAGEGASFQVRPPSFERQNPTVRSPKPEPTNA